MGYQNSKRAGLYWEIVRVAGGGVSLPSISCQTFSQMPWFSLLFGEKKYWSHTAVPPPHPSQGKWSNCPIVQRSEEGLAYSWNSSRRARSYTWNASVLTEIYLIFLLVSLSIINLTHALSKAEKRITKTTHTLGFMVIYSWAHECWPSSIVDWLT